MLSRSWVSEVEFKETIWESGRTTIIQVYCKETKQMKKLKFFDISRLTQVEVAFYLDAIATINYRHNQRREVTSSFYRNHQFQILPSKSKLVIMSEFIAATNLERVLAKMRSMQQEFDLELLAAVPMLLFQSFISYSSIGSLILTQQNLYMKGRSFIVNEVSFVGVEHIVFQKPISKLQFISIFNFVDSAIFDRYPHQRLNYKQKIKNFAALLLTFVAKGPIRLLESQHLPEMLTRQQSQKYIRKSKELNAKYLKMKRTQKLVEQKSRQFNFDLMNLLQIILVKEKEISWSQILTLLNHLQSCCSQEQGRYRKLAETIWQCLPQEHQNYFWEERLLGTAPRGRLNEDYQLFLALIVGEKISTLKDRSILKQLLEHRFDMKSTSIFHRCTKLVNYVIEESNSFHPSMQSRQFICESAILARILQEGEGRALQVEESLPGVKHSIKQGNNNDTIEQLVEQPSDWEGSFYAPQSKQFFINRVSSQNKEEQLFNTIYNLALLKKSHSLEIEDRTVKIEHDRLKCLNAYRFALR